MASPSPERPAPNTNSSPFPFATAPDIIRAHQKDAYFQGLLTNQLVDLHRRLLGARSAHTWANESRTAADLLYLCLTTLLGNRTLGEEYCDLIQVEAPQESIKPKNTNTGDEDSRPASSTAGGPQLPSLRRRSAYVTLSILLPYFLSRLLPSIRARIRARLEARLAALQRQHKAQTLAYRLQRYLLTHLANITSTAGGAGAAHYVHAVVLATFYFTGAYYSLSKRLTSLRYVFTRRLPQPPGGSGGAQHADGRAGYEVLGVLLVVQLAVQGYLHVRSTLAAAAAAGGGDGDEAAVEAAIRERAFGPRAGGGGAVNVSLDHEFSYSGNNDLLLNTGTTPGGLAASSGQRSKAAIGAMAHTPVPKGGDGAAARYDLSDGKTLAWIKGRSQRKCTLCLEELKDPSATGCGHVFCWSCIGDWVREKPECPLCRREVLVQHILPLRVM